MNNELLHHLEQRINQAVEEINALRGKISDLEMKNYELSEEKTELEAKFSQQEEQQANWENSLNGMLSRLNQLDKHQ
ncbi:cell division protein ZapB [Marinomonas sp. 15G1-11]|jgi:cell division protein ZapB|uniref:Cell division protein ZapB n=1 Tax=Marinomonas phaeophyticola TaxID=3004091 RepID=A0ABT4JUS5_9GAMM|nr:MULTISPECIES: cell division protein ZapB [Marinomonas]MCZ2722139.1 cell division protein ZapB [Marinomonas sp. 15G1-11]